MDGVINTSVYSVNDYLEKRRNRCTTWCRGFFSSDKLNLFLLFCPVENIHSSILPEDPGSGSAIKIGSRLIRIGFWSRSWSRLHLQNRDPVAKWKSLIDFEIRIADRFLHENRDPISCSVCTCGPKTGFQSGFDLQIKIADRFYRENRLLIFPDRFSIAIVIAIAFSKPGSGCEMVFFWNHYYSL